jgi:predicted PhzF superfamily epimerase YddE/YHI9
LLGDKQKLSRLAIGTSADILIIDGIAGSAIAKKCVNKSFGMTGVILEAKNTGSAHCTLVPYWAARLGKSSLTAKQLSPRGGDLGCRLNGSRVLMTGSAVEYLRGEIDVVV